MSTDAPHALDVARPPVILLGMHRSGTSLIARLLDELGLFQGDELQEDHESTHFLDINDTLMKRVGATWDNPAPIKSFLAHSDAVELTVQCLGADLLGRQIAGYLGRKRFAKYRGLAKLDQAWGWKDPRTVFTLPLWLALFPKAKLVYIIRNGVDVASSLRFREKRELARRIKDLESKKNATGRLTRHSLLQRAGFKGSARCLSLAGGFSLWEQYVVEAEWQMMLVGNERLIINYERLLDDPLDPQHGLAALTKFCGLEASQEALAQAVEKINAGRARAFLSDPELTAFYEQVKRNPFMVKYGYGNVDD